MLDNNMTTAGVQGWMVGSFVVEVLATTITWAVLPIALKVWTVGCLTVDAFMIIRELVLHPVQPTRKKHNSFVKSFA